MQVLQAVDIERIRALRARDEFFWLDLDDPDDETLDQLVELKMLHPLALEDTREFGQRIKLDDYAEGALLVVYGAEPRTEDETNLVEVHLHVFEHALITVRREPLAALGSTLRRTTAREPSSPRTHPVHQVLDALADSILNVLDGFDDEIDRLQEAVVEKATTTHRGRIFELRRQVTQLRQAVVPERDLLRTRYDDLVEVVPELGEQSARDHIRDVHDHLDRAAGLASSYREQLMALLDLYLTEVSNGMNEVMKRLTIIATVFLPLTFLTGFFGMNFDWFVQQISPMWVFLVFGVGLLVVSTVAVAAYLYRSNDD